ncbi:MAG: NUDIX domain-containing protein [Pseudomonadota bacterium]
MVLSRGKILLGLRSPERTRYPSVWDLFGGHVEAGETVEAGLVRELGEELDITPSEFDFLTVLRERDPYTDAPYSYHIYRVTTWAGAGPRRCSDEQTKIGWFTPDQAIALDLALPAYRRLFREHVT